MRLQPTERWFIHMINVFIRVRSLQLKRTVLFQVSQKQLPEQRSQQPAEKPSIGTVIIFLNRKNSIRLYIAIIHLRWMYRQTKSWPNCRMNLLPGKLQQERTANCSVTEEKNGMLLCRQHPEKRQQSEPWLRCTTSISYR